MIVIPVSNKTLLVRHWFKWYRVMRGGTDWHRLKVAPRATPFSISKVSKSLQAKYGTPDKMPTILDEIAADREAEKNTPKDKRVGNRTKKKGQPKPSPKTKIS